MSLKILHNSKHWIGNIGKYNDLKKKDTELKYMYHYKFI